MLVVVSVVEQRLDAVRAVLAGADVVEVAASIGVSRSAVHRWKARYLEQGLAGLADRSHRPRSCPHQVRAEVEVLVAEMRRAHPRWGSTRIRLELLRTPAAVSGELVVPAERTIDRILVRQHLLTPRPRKRPRSSYRRWERPGPMQLWQIDIVEGVQLVDVRTGEVREVKVVTGVDDHSRFCVMATVVERATGRAVCAAFAAALTRFGVPGEVLTDNGKQFTDRFGKGGEVLFDLICRKNGIMHRLTAPRTPNHNGKVERFHGTFRPEFLDTAGPFTSIAQAQAAVDAWALDYNHNRPHQGLDQNTPIVPAQRFSPIPQAEREVLPLWLPPTLTGAEPPPSDPRAADAPDPSSVLEPAPNPPQSALLKPDHDPATAPASPSPHGARRVGPGGDVAVEFDRVVPPSGNLLTTGRQFWLGPARAGKVVRFWADVNVLHLSIDGVRVKTVRSHLTTADLARLLTRDGVPAGPPPLPPVQDGQALEVDRCITSNGRVSLAGHSIPAAEILAGRRVGIRIEPSTLMLFDLDTRELLRTRPNPLTPDQTRTLRGLRPAGPPPRPATEPVTIQRRISSGGTVMVTRQKIALGRQHAGRTVTITVSDTTVTIHLDDGETRTVRRTTTQAVRGIKAHRPPASGTRVAR